MSEGTTFGCQNWSGVGPLLARGDHFWLPKVVPRDQFWQPKVVRGDQFWLPKVVRGTTFGRDHFWHDTPLTLALQDYGPSCCFSSRHHQCFNATVHCLCSLASCSCHFIAIVFTILVLWSTYCKISAISAEFPPPLQR